jgi:hypothetical protein
LVQAFDVNPALERRRQYLANLAYNEPPGSRRLQMKSDSNDKAERKHRRGAEKRCRATH